MLAVVVGSLSRIADSPDGTGAVVGDQQRAIGSNANSNRASPNAAIVDYKPDHEVFIFAGSVAGLVQWNANQFVACPRRFVPRTVFGSEDISSILGRELFSLIEGEFAGVVSGSSTLDAEPTETNIFLPSGENWMSRVQWLFPPGTSTRCSAGPRAFISPVLIGKAHYWSPCCRHRPILDSAPGDRS